MEKFKHKYFKYKKKYLNLYGEIHGGVNLDYNNTYKSKEYNFDITGHLGYYQITFYNNKQQGVSDHRYVTREYLLKKDDKTIYDDYQNNILSRILPSQQLRRPETAQRTGTLTQGTGSPSQRTGSSQGTRSPSQRTG